MTHAVTQHMGQRGFDPFAELGVGPAFVLWQILLWTALMTVWQSAAMRSFSAKNAATGRRVFTLTSVLFLGRAVLPMAWGIAAFAFFWNASPSLTAIPGEAPQIEMARLDRELGASFPSQLEKGEIATLLPQVDRLVNLAEGEGRHAPEAAAVAGRAQGFREELAMAAMPWMIASLLPTGALGLMMAGMLAASVSTYAGYFLGWSAVISQDVVSPLLARPLSDSGKLRLTRVTIVALTLFILIWSLVYHVPGPAFFYLQVTANLFMAPTLITIAGGLYWRRASSAGAYASFILGAAASLGYLVPSLGLSVATAGNATWILGLLGLVVGSLLWPDPPRQEAR
jgi:Na+/proline symporter